MEIENKSIIEKRKATMEKGLKQIAALEEQETTVLIDYFQRKIKIYTNRASVANRLERAGFKYSKQDTVDGQVYSRSYVFDTKDIGKFLRTSIFKFD